MDWEIPVPKASLEENITNSVRFYAADCSFGGYIEALVINWLHPLMLAAKIANTNGDKKIMHLRRNKHEDLRVCFGGCA